MICVNESECKCNEITQQTLCVCVNGCVLTGSVVFLLSDGFLTCVLCLDGCLLDGLTSVFSHSLMFYLVLISPQCVLFLFISKYDITSLISVFIQSSQNKTPPIIFSHIYHIHTRVLEE